MKFKYKPLNSSYKTPLAWGKMNEINSILNMPKNHVNARNYWTYGNQNPQIQSFKKTEKTFRFSHVINIFFANC